MVCLLLSKAAAAPHRGRYRHRHPHPPPRRAYNRANNVVDNIVENIVPIKTAAVVGGALGFGAATLLNQNGK